MSQCVAQTGTDVNSWLVNQTKGTESFSIWRLVRGEKKP